MAGVRGFVAWRRWAGQEWDGRKVRSSKLKISSGTFRKKLRDFSNQENKRRRRGE